MNDKPSKFNWFRKKSEKLLKSNEPKKLWLTFEYFQSIGSYIKDSGIYLKDLISYYLEISIESSKDWLYESEEDLIVRKEVERQKNLRAEIDRYQNENRRHREKLIEKNRKKDIGQLNRELKTCTQHFENEKWIIEKIAEEQKGEIIFDESGRPQTRELQDVFEGQTNLNPKRIEKVCDELKKVKDENFAVNQKSLPASKEVFVISEGAEKSDNSCGSDIKKLKEFNQKLTKEINRCQNDFNGVKNKLIESKESALELQTKITEISKNNTILRQKVENFIEDPEFEQKCIDALKNSNHSIPNRTRVENIRISSGIANRFEKILVAFIYALTWPLHLMDPKFILWKQVEHLLKITYLERLIISIIVGLVYYGGLLLLFAHIWSLLFPNPKNSYILEEKSDLEEKSPSGKNLFGQIKKRSQSRKTRAAEIVTRIPEGGSIDRVDTTLLLLDPVFATIIFHKVINNLEFEKIEIEKIPFQNRLSSLKNRFSFLKKLQTVIKKVFINEKTYVIFSICFYIIIQIALEENTHKIDRNFQKNYTFQEVPQPKQPIEIIESRKTIEILRKKQNTNSNTISESKKVKFKTQKQKKRVPLSQRTQTLEGLRKAGKLDEFENAEILTTNVETQNQKLKIRISDRNEI